MWTHYAYTGSVTRFSMVVARIRDPKTIALIFPSGETIVTGAKSEDDSRLVPLKYPWYVLLRTQAKGCLADFRVNSCPPRSPRLPRTPTRLYLR
ncbi:hypothetical protein FRC12_003711 [Ceratobasidium sp. 428]|nr:hypothetical protein FRC12_003711 [Ceratobasidium sp. 428]